MNIKSKISKLVSGLLCFSMIFSNVLPAYAADAVITENTLDGEDLSVNERNLEDITVTYKQASSFFVTIPKTIVLDGWKQSTYAVKVSGDIDAEQCVYVAPVDGIADTENIDFYMRDQASENAKDDVVANVTHNKFHWNSAEVAAGHKQADNLVEAPDLTAGAWKGIFQMEIKLETHVTHKHNYVETITKEPTCTETGEKTYTCDCGDSYTEEIPAKGHHFEDGECTDCGEKDSDYHKHNYVETITKEPTCTEKGKKTFTCSCGDSYTEEIAAKGHHFEDGTCSICGGKCTHNFVNGTCTICGHTHNYVDGKCECGAIDPNHTHNYVDGTCTICGETDSYWIAPVSAYSNWDYDLDDEANTIKLNYYIGSETDVIVYANYVVAGKTYKTQIASSRNNSNTHYEDYMFDANAGMRTNCKNIKTIAFSKAIDTSDVTSMYGMFSYCLSLTSLDISGFDTSNVTNIENMFRNCNSLTSLDLSNFNTSKITNMYGMFIWCRSLTSLDLSGLDTSNVTNMQNMFSNCTSLTSLDLSNFDTSNVTNMQSMFSGCSSLTKLDISSFDTSNVTDMSGMFMNCSSSSLTKLDISSFDTHNVTNMNSMFYACSHLRTIYVTEGKWIIPKTNVKSMFYSCGTSSVTYK